MTKQKFMIEFGDNLRDLLKERSMTQNGLAKELGVSQPAVSDYVNGFKMPSLPVFNNICCILVCDPDDLIDSSCMIDWK